MTTLAAILLPLFGQTDSGRTFRNLVGVVAFIGMAAFMLWLTRSKKK